MNNNIKNKILTTFPQLKPIEDWTPIKDGTKVKINSKSIIEQPNYNTMIPKYKEFIESNINTIFIAHQSKYHNIIEIKDADYEWYFWIGDLIIVEDN